jgi:hypothetical protein
VAIVNIPISHIGTALVFLAYMATLVYIFVIERQDIRKMALPSLFGLVAFTGFVMIVLGGV